MSTICPLPHGTRFKCELGGHKIDKAELAILYFKDGIIISICQDLICGGSADNQFGFKESWDIVDTRPDGDPSQKDWNTGCKSSRFNITEIISLPGCPYKNGDQVMIKFEDMPQTKGEVFISPDGRVYLLQNVWNTSDDFDDAVRQIVSNRGYICAWEVYSPKYMSWLEGMRENSVEFVSPPNPSNECPFKHGELVTVTFSVYDNEKTIPAVVSINEDGSVFVCQEDFDGQHADEMLGFACSWAVFDVDNHASFQEGCKENLVEIKKFTSDCLPFKDGDQVVFSFEDDNEFPLGDHKGTIWVTYLDDKWKMYLCQDAKSGSDRAVKYGFKYTWFIGTAEDLIRYENCLGQACIQEISIDPIPRESVTPTVNPILLNVPLI